MLVHHYGVTILIIPYLKIWQQMPNCIVISPLNKVDRLSGTGENCFARFVHKHKRKVNESVLKK